MSSVEFLRPRYCGGRFERGGLPLDVLGDLAAFNQMVADVAKWCFLQEHTDRKRVPKGFGRGIDCRITGLEGGSVIPIISLDVAQPHLLVDTDRPYYEAARDLIVHAVDVANDGKLEHSDLTGRHLAYFKQFGRSLSDNEAIELGVPSQTSSVRLTTVSRERLVRESSRRLDAGSLYKSSTQPEVFRGRIPEVDQDKMTFEMQLRGGRRVTGPLSKEHSSVILDAFNHYHKHRRVRVHASVRHKHNRPDQVETVEDVTLLDRLDIGAQLDDLRELKPGWMNGEGVVPNHEGLDWLEDQFRQHFRGSDLLPHLYPTLTGGVQAEWTIGTREVSLEVNLQTRQAEWYWLDVSSNDEEDRMLDLNSRSSWTWLCGRLCQMGESDIE